jgi:hypothetical protein
MALLELAAAKEVDGAMVGHPEQPGEQSAATRLVGVGLAPELEEGLLDDFLGRRTVAQHTQRQRVHASAVAFVHQLEGPRIGTRDRGDQLGIVPDWQIERQSQGWRRLSA